MMKSTNIPYIKEYDKNGNLKNPINGIYVTGGLNRQQRRESMQKNRRIQHNYKFGGCSSRNLQAIFFPRKKRAKDKIACR